MAGKGEVKERGAFVPLSKSLPLFDRYGLWLEPRITKPEIEIATSSRLHRDSSQ
jgi:hypothetical protein